LRLDGSHFVLVKTRLRVEKMSSEGRESMQLYFIHSTTKYSARASRG
jgi:hypothetical protein